MPQSLPGRYKVLSSIPVQREKVQVGMCDSASLIPGRVRRAGGHKWLQEVEWALCKPSLHLLPQRRGGLGISTWTRPHLGPEIRPNRRRRRPSRAVWLLPGPVAEREEHRAWFRLQGCRVAAFTLGFLVCKAGPSQHWVQRAAAG